MANTPQGQQPESNKPKKTGYLVCDGALCICDAGAKPAKLKVKENKKVYINDDSTKLLATEKDFNFDPPTAPFVSCKNAPSQNKTCTPKFEQWLKTYDAITAEGKKVLVDKSELLCMQYGGKVTVLKHGQVQKVSKVQEDNMTQNMTTELNALAPPKKTTQKESNVSVTGIKGEPVEDEQFKPVNGEPRKAVTSYTNDQIKADPAKKTHPAQLFLRPKEEAKFTATYKNDAELISWKIEGYEGASPFYYLQYGPNYTVCFPEKGTYKIEAYGTLGDGQLDWDANSADGTKRNPDPSCQIEIVVRPNEIKKLRLVGDGSQIIHGAASSEDSVRANVPLTIEPVFLMPAAQSDIQHLVLLIKDEAGIELSRAEGQPSIVFTPTNTGMSYRAEAYFNGTEDDTRHTLSFKTISNAVKVIGGSVAEESKVRPGTEITFSVKEYTFQGQPKDLETQEIKWKQVGIENPIATGPNFKKVFNNEGNYIIEAYVRTANAYMPSIFKGKGEPDDWRFTVTRNYPTGIVAKGKAKVGLTIHYQMESIFPLTAEERKSITWSVTGPVAANVGGSEAIKIPFTKQGRYTIKASLNGQTKEFIADCTECKIIEGWWTDGDGNHLTGEDTEGEPRNTIGFASWGQDACVAIRHVGLEGEKMTLEIWDRDTVTDDPVAKKEITIPNTDRPGFSISLDEDMKKKAGTELIGADALLYFTLTPVNTQLKVQNAGAAFPSASTFYLKVDSNPRVKAYFSDNNDTKRYATASVETAVHAQVKTTALQDEELTVEIWESIPWAPDKKYLVGGNKKPDKYGMLSLPLKLKDIPLKDANETKLLYIKVLRKKNGEVLYDSDGKYNLTLYKVLKNEATSKGTTKALVVVDVSEGTTGGCGEKHCLKKGSPKSELIREINIRLAGFGGNVPTDEFTDRTEKMVKQFQKDYMKVPETGKVCGNVLNAIDDFSKKFNIDSNMWHLLSCSCSTKGKKAMSKLYGIKEDNKCEGFGDQKGKGNYKNAGTDESVHLYEYPGIHRSLLFGVKALMFYLSTQTEYSLGSITSGYRCRFKNFKTTNHQGKAIDIQFNKGDWKIRYLEYRNIAALEDIRDKFFTKYLKAVTNWQENNSFSMEPIGVTKTGDNIKEKDGYTYSWIHLDVRKFESIYLEDKYFVKNVTALNGKSLRTLASESGNLVSTCFKINKQQEITQNQTVGTGSKRGISTDGIKFIVGWEDFKGELYDKDGGGHCTIGYGHLVHRGACNGTEPEEFKKGITKERAIELKMADAKTVEDCLNRNIKVEVSQSQYDALASLVFNIGETSFGSSTLLKLLNEGSYSEVGDQFLIWNKSGGGVVDGLSKRREKEKLMFNDGIYDSKH